MPLSGSKLRRSFCYHAHRAQSKAGILALLLTAQDTLAFSVRSGVRSMNEVYPLERAAEAYDRMLSGKAHFRVVLTTGR